MRSRCMGDAAEESHSSLPCKNAAKGNNDKIEWAPVDKGIY